MKKNKRLLEHTKYLKDKKSAVIARTQDVQRNDLTLTVIFCDLGGALWLKAQNSKPKKCSNSVLMI